MKEKNSERQHNIQDPFVPINLPKKMVDKKPKNGKESKQRYIIK